MQSSHLCPAFRLTRNSQTPGAPPPSQVSIGTDFTEPDWVHFLLQLHGVWGRKGHQVFILRTQGRGPPLPSRACRIQLCLLPRKIGTESSQSHSAGIGQGCDWYRDTGLIHGRTHLHPSVPAWGFPWCVPLCKPSEKI